jgi:hypothetical protein
MTNKPIHMYGIYMYDSDMAYVIYVCTPYTYVICKGTVSKDMKQTRYVAKARQSDAGQCVIYALNFTSSLEANQNDLGAHAVQTCSWYLCAFGGGSDVLLGRIHRLAILRTLLTPSQAGTKE